MTESRMTLSARARTASLWPYGPPMQKASGRPSSPAAATSRARSSLRSCGHGKGGMKGRRGRVGVWRRDGPDVSSSAVGVKAS